ncbi:MAG: phosphoglycerate kinase [Bacteroidota bacterium]
MQTIKNYNFSGKKAIVRVDFNVPMNDQFEITDDTRMRKALPTINKIVDDGGSAILMSHLGRPKGSYEEKYSLKHAVSHLSKLLNKDVKFAEDCIGAPATEKASGLQSGEVLLLENLRFYNEEKKGDKQFAQQLADMADVYVNDAFGTAHRAHASTTIVADFFDADNKMFGFIIDSELISLDKVLLKPERPFTAIMGGAKVSDKIQVIENLLNKVDNILIGGGMTYTFVKAQGGQIGNSKVENEMLDTAKGLLEKAKEKNVNIYLPVDNVIADDFSNDANTEVTNTDAVKEGWMGLDIADQAVKDFSEVIANSKTILWNGPMGVFEMEKFKKGTVEIAKAIASATDKGAFSLVGGGDSVAAVNQFNLADRVSYVSTGGGAMLEYVEGKELPGIKAIRG